MAATITPLRRNILILLLLNWIWILGSALTSLTPEVATNQYRQTIAHWTLLPQKPSAGHEMVRFGVAHMVGAGQGFKVPQMKGANPDVATLPGPTSSDPGRAVPRFSPLYGLFLGGLTKLTAMFVSGGVVDGSLPALIVYRVLTIVPALIAATLLCWTFGHSVDLRGLHDRRWWLVMIPVTLISPLALRETYLNEHALAAALLWAGLAQLNTCLFRVAKEQPCGKWAISAGILLMLAAGLVPLALAAVIGFGGVLLASQLAPMQRIGRELAIGVGIAAVLVVASHMWGFDKLLPLLAYYEPDIRGAVKTVVANLIGSNGLLWMFPLAGLGLIVLVSRILRTQELEEAKKVDLFRTGQGAFHWGAYWTLLSAVGLAVVDSAFFYGIPSIEEGAELGRAIQFAGHQISLFSYLHHYGGDGWVVLLPLAAYYCTFIFREPVLESWQPWYHNLSRVGLFVWFFGCAQPAGGWVFPLVEAAYRWATNVATYYPLGRLE